MSGGADDDEIQFEFVPITAAGDDEEELTVGTRHRSARPRHPLAHRLGRVPTAAWTGLVVLIVLVGALVETAGRHSGHPSAAVSTTSPAPAPSTTTTAAVPPAPAAPSSSPDADEDALDQLIYLADTPGSLTPNIRGAGTTPSCPPVPVGVDPTTTVTTELQRLMPEFTVNSSAVTMNADATLCGLDVRATDGHGDVLIVQMSAPPFGYGPAFQAQRSNDRSTALDVATFTGGWRVEVGWAGQTGAAQVSYADLEKVAQDQRLRW